MDISLIAFLLILLVLSASFFFSRRRDNLPPGPKGWPIIGNLFDMPKEATWSIFAEWGKIYGDISSVTVFGQTIVIINSLHAAKKMLNDKGSIYSDRPKLPMGGELMGWKDALPLLGYNDRLQLYRKRFHKLFGTSSVTSAFHESEAQAVQIFLRSVSKTPKDLIKYIKKHVGTVALRIVYGFDVTDNNDEFVHLLDRGMGQFGVATAPGAFLVDVLPVLRYLPSWLPGVNFHTLAQTWRSNLEDMVTKPYDHLQLNPRGETHSFMSTFLTREITTEEELRDLKWNGSSVAAGGFSTRLSAIQGFFLMMALHPDIQAKARAEIETVVGTDRYPTFADRENLPYVDAICREVFRFHTVVPNGLPHVVVEDDVHDGLFIPKGSIVIANLWNMTHDPETYADPHVFNPSRFISSEEHKAERDVYEIIFGFGRRICPGRVLADGTLFIMAAMSLAVLDISKNGDDTNYHPLSGTVSQPAPFTCSIKVRSAEVLALLNS